MPAPIVLFAYNRPEHTRKTVEALQRNAPAGDSDLFIFSDAPRDESAKEAVGEVRSYIKNITGFKNISIIERDKNFGLADSIIDGVTRMADKYGKIIVLEDDIVTSPAFLKYMNDALDLYENDERVMHVSGYFPPIKNDLPDTFFYNQTSCWGWGTWARAWENYNGNAGSLIEEVKKRNQAKKLDIDGSIGFMSTLRANAAGEIKTWAVKWHASVFLAGGLCLHPNKSLVLNIGHDGTGINSEATNAYGSDFARTAVKLERQELRESPEARRLVSAFNLSLKPSIITRIKNKIKKYGNNKPDYRIIKRQIGR